MPMNNVGFVAMPYCLKKQENGRYIVLNREYKPIGFFTYDHLDYADYPISVHLPDLSEKTIKQLSHNGKSNADNIFLYDDGCVPFASSKHFKSYANRLQLLVSLKVG